MTESHPTPHPRVVVDANVLISYLIGRGRSDSTIIRAVRLVLGGRFELIVPEGLLMEIRDAPHKPKLVPVLSSDEVEELIQLMLRTLEAPVVTASLSMPVPELGRDPKDRYLLEAAIEHDVDILVSGDKDLLALAPYLELPRIMSPADFVAAFGEVDG